MLVVQRVLAGSLTLLPLAMIAGGCAQSRSAAGTFVGTTGVAELRRASDGSAVEAITLRIEHGPPMSSPHVRPPVPTEGLEVVLVDGRQRIIDAGRFARGTRVRVEGRVPTYAVRDRDGGRLTTPDGKNVGGALRLTDGPRAVAASARAEPRNVEPAPAVERYKYDAYGSARAGPNAPLRSR
jgi:hypothetical protein